MPETTKLHPKQPVAAALASRAAIRTHGCVKGLLLTAGLCLLAVRLID